MTLTPNELAARYGDTPRKSERTEISPERFERAVDRGDRGAWGVGALVIDDGRGLFVQEGDTWLLPGGRLEPDETPEAGARREVREETGVTIEVIGLAAIAEQTFVNTDDGDDFEFNFATFLGEPRSTGLAADPGRPDEGIDEVAWRSDVPANTFDRDLVVRLLETHR